MTDPILVPSAQRSPWHWRRHPAFAGDRRTRGERAADKMRSGMGSWAFVFGFLGFMVVWAILNVAVLAGGFDPYPFILLNLFLSMLAGLQGAILLIAAKRADQIAARVAMHTLAESIKSDAKLDALLAHLGIPVPASILTIDPDDPEGGR